MRQLIQAVSVFVIAVGIGMLVAGSAARPTMQVLELGNGRAEFSMSTRDAEFFHGLSVGLNGFGAGFLTLGLLAPLVPWANILVDELRKRNSSGKPAGSAESA